MKTQVKNPLNGKNVFITGGAGTLGRAIIRRARDEGWGCDFTVFSTDAIKHINLKRKYPHVRTVVGDIRDQLTLQNAMAGHDIVIHAAAVKHIPVSEWNSVDTFAINVEGSMNVCAAAIQNNIEVVVGISTDKACHPANAYGATKMLMEKTFEEYSRIPGIDTKFKLVRYGNVLESTGSVIEVWRKSVMNGEPIKITLPEMTRFWISPYQAVEYILETLEIPNGCIFVPEMKALSIIDLAEFAITGDWTHTTIPLRPGEKIHETLITVEEMERTDYRYAFKHVPGVIVLPSVGVPYDLSIPEGTEPYTSFVAQQLTHVEFEELISYVE